MVSCRRYSTYQPEQTAKTAQLAPFAAKMLPTLPSAGHRADLCGISPISFFIRLRFTERQPSILPKFRNVLCDETTLELHDNICYVSVQ
jgi:hypothetical protein